MASRTLKKRSLPTAKEAAVLKRIALDNGLVVMHLNGRTEYSTAGGLRIERAVAERSIFRGWIVGDRGDSLFDCIPQRYRVPSVVSGGGA
jgi:hypothetical protein